MSEDRQRDGEKFLDRWSRLKQEARTQTPSPAAEKRNESGPLPQLPSLESLTFDSDFSAFMHPEVDDGLRRTALKKLFSNPHFNHVDGLDVYIDDYSGADPIPPALLESLMKDRRKLFARDDETAADETAAVAGGDEALQSADATPTDSALPAPESHPDGVMPETALRYADPVAPAAPPPDPDGKLTTAETPAGAKEDDTRSP